VLNEGESTTSVQELEESPFDSDLPLYSPPSSPETISAALPQENTIPKPELRYVSMLNRVLPPTIRALAWAPVSPSFSSRFACKYRYYKYFFHVQQTKGGLDLDVQKMMDAAERLIGEHDFRNLCKVDASKQITSFKRRILRADINFVNDDPHASPPTSTTYPAGMYVFNLIGTAFLYHQVRHIMAILFLVGAGLEPPSIVSALLNADKEHPYGPYKEGEGTPEVVECKPEYQMADGLPLMLWECGYDPRDVVWRTDDGVEQTGGEIGGEEEGNAQAQESEGNVHLVHQLSAMHTRSLIHETLDEHFLLATKEHYPPPPAYFPLSSYLPYPIPAPPPSNNTGNDSAAIALPDELTPSTILPIPIGGGVVRRTAVRGYVPLLRRKRLDPVEVINERWRQGKGSRRIAKGNAGDDGGDE
jgi:tRNA pseudouridine38/39 synthase